MHFPITKNNERFYSLEDLNCRLTRRKIKFKINVDQANAPPRVTTSVKAKV
jgi:hypothetical protein